MSLFDRTLAAWGIKWPGWVELERRFSSSKDKSLKTYMLKTLKIHHREEELVSALLAEARPGRLVGSPLHAAIQTVLAKTRPTTIDDAR